MSVIIKLVAGGFAFSTFVLILMEALDAWVRVRRESSQKNKETFRLVLTHQLVLLSLFFAVLGFTLWSQPRYSVSWPEFILGVVFIYHIRKVARIDERIVHQGKAFENAAEQAAKQTPTQEGGAS